MAEGTHASAERERPLSPHLQIWGWTVTMATSITHRATGIALYGGFILLTVWFFAASLGAETYAPVGAIVSSPLGLVVLLGFAWALIFHTLNGLRHLYWDSGRGLGKETSTMTSWLVYVMSIVLTLAVFALALNARGNV